VCKIRILESVVYGSGYISIAFGYECRRNSSIQKGVFGGRVKVGYRSI